MNKLESRIARLENALGANKRSPVAIIVSYASPTDPQPALLGYKWEADRVSHHCLRQPGEDDESLRARAELESEGIDHMGIRILYEMRDGA